MTARPAVAEALKSEDRTQPGLRTWSGDGREHSFFAYADSTCQGTMLAVVSLMQSGDTEVRLFKPAPASSPDSPASEQAGYALFHLKRRDEDNCGF